MTREEINAKMGDRHYIKSHEEWKKEFDRNNAVAAVTGLMLIVPVFMAMFYLARML